MEINNQSATTGGAWESSAQQPLDHALRDRQDKEIQTVRARAALRGYALHLLGNQGGGGEFMVSRWNLSRTFPDLDGVKAFLKQAGVRDG